MFGGRLVVVVVMLVGIGVGSMLCLWWFFFGVVVGGDGLFYSKLDDGVGVLLLVVVGWEVEWVGGGGCVWFGVFGVMDLLVLLLCVGDVCVVFVGMLNRLNCLLVCDLLVLLCCCCCGGVLCCVLLLFMYV